MNTTDVLQKTITHFRTQFPYIEEQDVEAVLDLITFKKFEPNDFYVKLGELHESIFWVVEGLFRAYYLDENGEEVIINFYKENDLTGAWYCTLLEEPSQMCIEAIEPSLIIQARLSDLDQLAETNMNIMKAYNTILKQKLIGSLQNIWSNMNLKPAERYQQFCKEKAGLIDRVPQKYIASYLGITPVSLSRLKKRILLKEA